MNKRTKVRNTYVTRRKNGQFKSVTKIGNSLRADRRVKTMRRAAPGEGHQGDHSGVVPRKAFRKLL